MSVNMEMKTFRGGSSEDDAIEEYHEVQTPREITKAENSTTSLLGFDFFSKINVNRSTNKKKDKKKEEKNLMDIISSELAAAESPVTGNVVTRVANFEDQAHYIVEEVKGLDRFRSRHTWSTFSSNNLTIRPEYPYLNESSSLSKPILTRYVKPKIYEDGYSTPHQMTKFLNIKISDLKFKIHHCFTLEELLVQKLITVFEEYHKHKESSQLLTNELKVTRQTKFNLKNELYEVMQNKRNIIFDPTIRKYTAKIIQLKSIYRENIKKEIEYVKMLHSLWADTLAVRDKQGFIRTSVALDISERDEDMDKSETFEIEFSDLVDRMEFDFVTKYLEYKEHKKRTESEDKRLTKPKLNLSEELLKEHAQALADDITKINKWEIQLNLDDKTLNKHITRENVNVVPNFYFKIYVDDVFVCESEFYTDRSYDLKFEDFFSVEILETNKTLTIALFENNIQASSMNVRISDIKKSITSTNSEKIEFIFMHEIPYNSRNIGSGNTIRDIGSYNKIRLKSCNLFKGKLYTACETNLTIGWNEDLNPSEQEAIIEYKKTEQKITRLINGMEELTIDTLKDLVEKVYNIEIPDDENVIEALNNLNNAKASASDSLEFSDEIENFSRLKLLHLRSKGELYDLSNKSIPFHANQFTTDQIKCLRNIENEQVIVDETIIENTDPIEIQRFKSNKHIEKLNNRVQKNLNEQLLQKSVRDVVWDFNNLPFSFRSLISRPSPASNEAAVNVNQKRHLGDQIASANENDLDVLITINKAYNLPERNLPAIVEDSSHGDDSIAGFKVKALRPFVKCFYGGNYVQTATAIGCHPTWNHTLKAKAKESRNRVLQINLFDELKEPILDGSVSEQSYQGTLRYRCHNRWIGAIRIPVQGVLSLGKFQGTFKIDLPLYLLGYEHHSNAREGNPAIAHLSQLLRNETAYLSMQISVPKKSTPHHSPLPNDGNDYVVKHLNKYLSRFINEYPTRNISLTFIDSSGKNKCVTQFIQPILLPDYEVFPKNPKKSDSAKSSNLSKSSSSKSGDGRKSLDVEKGLQSLEIEKDSIYSGYDRSWKSDNDLDKLIDVALRYVSLIPTYEVSDNYVVTLNPVELLRTLYGSPLDHTLLLASYFTYLGLKTYIAVGIGLPRGVSSYVVTKYDGKSRKMQLTSEEIGQKRSFLFGNETCLWYLYDAVKGERYELRDVSCPLKTVEYVFNNENIWVNVQNSQDCENVFFNLTKRSDWYEVFDKTVFVLKQPLISDAHLYHAPKSPETLRAMLEERIKFKIQKWRTHYKTVWNRYCSTLLRELLPYLEYWSLHPTGQKPSLGQKLKQMMLTYKMYGFPINVPFNNRKAIISTIKSTGIHLSDDPYLEFGLAVEVYAYPNDVFSVWVFIVCLSRI